MPLRMNSRRARQKIALRESDLACLRAQADVAAAADQQHRRGLRLGAAHVRDEE
jgi:hypothetical protein